MGPCAGRDGHGGSRTLGMVICSALLTPADRMPARRPVPVLPAGPSVAGQTRDTPFECQRAVSLCRDAL